MLSSNGVRFPLNQKQGCVATGAGSLGTANATRVRPTAQAQVVVSDSFHCALVFGCKGRGGSGRIE